MKILATWVLIFISYGLHAQFVSGFIIDNQEDTLYRQLKYEGSIINGKRCIALLENGSEIEYSPNEIKEFRFKNSKYFVSENISVDGLTERVFLECLIAGRIEILKYTDKKLEQKYFLRTQNDTLIELENNDTEKRVGDKTYVSKDFKYKGILIYYTKDCPELKTPIQTLTYDDKAFINLTKEYQNLTCDSIDCELFEDKSRKYKYSLLVGTNLQQSKIHLNNGIEESFAASSSLGVGVGIRLSGFFTLSHKFALSAMVEYYQMSDEYVWNGQGWENMDNVIESKIIRLPVQYSYKFLDKKITPLLSLGISPTWRLSYQVCDQQIMDYITEHYLYDLGLSKIRFGLTGGIGVSFEVSSLIALETTLNYDHDFSYFGTYIADRSTVSNYILRFNLALKL